MNSAPQVAATDPPGKTRHCMLMLYAAATLAECAPDDLQARALARYTFMYADAFLGWARRWRVQLSHNKRTERLAHQAKTGLRALENALDSAGQIRNYLAAKRQPVASMRSDDVEATSLLWAAVNHPNVHAIWQAAHSSYQELSGEDITAAMEVDAAVLRAVSEALPARDTTHWYLAADTPADRRLHTLPAAQGGELGRIVAQINDVANHLDVLLRLAPVLYGVLPFDWLIRSAMVIEVDSLLNLAIGRRYVNKISYPLIDLCRAGRSEVAADRLDQVRAGIDRPGWDYVCLLRNKLGAHVDSHLTMIEIHQHLIELDYLGVVRLAESLLDQLDALGATQMDLKLLLFGERKINSWPVDPEVVAPGRPHVPVLPGALAKLFRQINSPFIAATASSRGSPILAAKISSRQAQPRQKVRIRARRHPLLEIAPIHYRSPSGAMGFSAPVHLG